MQEYSTWQEILESRKAGKLTTNQVAERLGVSVSYVQVLAVKKRLPAIKVSRDWYFEESGVEAFEKKRQKPGRPKKQ